MDGQFGSCGKGAFISARAHYEEPEYVVRVGGPQAGHSMYGPCPSTCEEVHGVTASPGGHSHIWKMRQIPAAWHVPGTTVVIGRGAMIDLHVLFDEITAIESTGRPLRLLVDDAAFVVEDRHRDAERADSFGTHGTTREGVGVARAHMAMRTAMQVGEFIVDDPNYDWLAPYLRENTAATLRFAAIKGEDVWIEGTQGFGLSLRASGFYPYVTSADITPQQLLSDTGLHWNDAEVKTTMLLRTYPIRIAGNSGPLDEIGWDEIEVPPVQPEQTTVSKMQRRIGRFDMERVRLAVAECNPDEFVVTFLDYLLPENRIAFIQQLQEAVRVPVTYGSVGFEDVVRYGELG